MNSLALEFVLSFEGRSADAHAVDLYDVSQALVGFQRSLALTSHLVLNGEIITQAPSLKGAQILALPPEEGSWKVAAVIVAGAYGIGTAPTDTPLGHIVHSAYDYVISESLGVHVDYDKSLGQMYEEAAQADVPTERVEQYQLDSLVEKCTTAVREMHRPIYKTRTAESAIVTSSLTDHSKPVGGRLDSSTYEYAQEIFVEEQPEVISGRISSYNSNTYKGRIYVAAEGRPIPFELSESCRTNEVVSLIAASLSANAIRDYDNEWSTVHCRVFRNVSRSGQLRKFKIVAVSHKALR